MSVNLDKLRRQFAVPFGALVALAGAASVVLSVSLGHSGWPVVATVAAAASIAAIGLSLKSPTSEVTRWGSTVLLMLQVALLVFAAEGTSFQTDLHMAFFAGLAIAAFWCCPVSILLGTVFVAVHHLTLNFAYPVAVFPTGANLVRVMVHAVILVAEAAALMALCRSLARTLFTSESATKEAQSALAAQREAEGQQAVLEEKVKSTRQHTEDLILATVGKAVDAAKVGDFSQRYSAAPELGRLGTLVSGLTEMNEVVDTATAELVSVLNNVARGDLTHRVSTPYQGRFDELKQAINHTIERLSSTVETIQTTSADVNSAAAEIRSGATDLSTRTEQQATSLEETAATAEELAASVKASAHSSRHAVELARQAMATAGDGGAIVREAIDAMARIEKASQKISDIIGLIDEIAFQTNLLALNAAVEAARAGDAGKGFAVVASEVRTLAQRSSAAAKDITGLINSSGAEVANGVKLVRGAGEALDKIVDASRIVSDTVSEISVATGEQASGIDALTQAIAHLDQITQQNAALAEESAASATSLSEQIERLNGLAGTFQTMAQRAIPSARRIAQESFGTRGWRAAS